MENSKQWLKDNHILPKVQFEPNKPRTVQIIQDKREQFQNARGEQVDGIKYKVMEDGEVKTILTTSKALISKLAEVEPESFVRITQKIVNMGSGPIKTYEVVEVSEGGEKIVTPEVDENEIPVIEEEDYGEPPAGMFGK